VGFSLRSSDDADVIRARLRALLDEGRRSGGWLPDDPYDDAEPCPGQASGGGPEDEEPGAASLDRPAADEPEAALPSGIGRHRSPGRATRWDPGRLGARSLWAAGLTAALLLAGWTWLDRPRVEPVTEVASGTAAPSSVPSAPSAPPVGEVADTSTTVVVSVVGLVSRPGLVTLQSGSRVADAVAAAGGLLPGTDPASVNLAAVVTDGQQITVGVPGTSGGAVGGDPAPGSPGSGGRVNLNTATATELDALPGVGPVLARRIVDHRSAHGPFRSVDELDDVPGIGPAIAAELTELVTV
jgi:competence protein ComEA